MKGFFIEAIPLYMAWIWLLKFFETLEDKKPPLGIIYGLKRCNNVKQLWIHTLQYNFKNYTPPPYPNKEWDFPRNVYSELIHLLSQYYVFNSEKNTHHSFSWENLVSTPLKPFQW